MISNGRLLPSASAISAISGVMLPPSLRTGTTTETAGRASLSRCSLMTLGHGRWADGASFLWGDKLSGNPFDAGERRPRQRATCPIRVPHEAEPARREPIAHQQGADEAE